MPTPTQTETIRMLETWFPEGALPYDIARHLGISEAAAIGRLQRLVDQGYIAGWSRWTRSPRDRVWKPWSDTQRELLKRAASVKASRDSVYVSGDEVAVAQELEKMGYGRVGDGGYLVTFAISEQGLMAVKSW